MESHPWEPRLRRIQQRVHNPEHITRMQAGAHRHVLALPLFAGPVRREHQSGVHPALASFSRSSSWRVRWSFNAAMHTEGSTSARRLVAVFSC